MRFRYQLSHEAEGTAEGIPHQAEVAEATAIVIRRAEIIRQAKAPCQEAIIIREAATIRIAVDTLLVTIAIPRVAVVIIQIAIIIHHRIQIQTILRMEIHR